MTAGRATELDLRPRSDSPRDLFRRTHLLPLVSANRASRRGRIAPSAMRHEEVSDEKDPVCRSRQRRADSGAAGRGDGPARRRPAARAPSPPSSGARAPPALAPRGPSPRARLSAGEGRRCRHGPVVQQRRSRHHAERRLDRERQGHERHGAQVRSSEPAGMHNDDHGSGGGDRGGDNGDRGDHGDRGDDRGQDEQICATGALTTGAVVHDAELRITSFGAFWEEVEVVTESLRNKPRGTKRAAAPAPGRRSPSPDRRASAARHRGLRWCTARQSRHKRSTRLAPVDHPWGRRRLSARGSDWRSAR